jgi:hypothetical protein
MSDPGVTVYLDREDPSYFPGETLSATYHVVPEGDRGVEAVEVSVLWYTEGKGDEDLGVHSFERLSAEHVPVDLDRPQRFSTRLPRSPLSYDGLIVKVCWCVRVRAFCRGGREMFGEAPFRLGNVAPAREVPS